MSIMLIMSQKINQAAPLGGFRIEMCHYEYSSLRIFHLKYIVTIAMALIDIYQCLCDETRLRILNLLTQGPLCVCHFQEALRESQVKISKHLAYLKAHGCVEASRHRYWMVYSLPKKTSAQLKANLKCLQDCVQSDRLFSNDLRRAKTLRKQAAWSRSPCCTEMVASAK